MDRLEQFNKYAAKFYSELATSIIFAGERLPLDRLEKKAGVKLCYIDDFTVLPDYSDIEKYGYLDEVSAILADHEGRLIHNGAYYLDNDLYLYLLEYFNAGVKHTVQEIDNIALKAVLEKYIQKVVWTLVSTRLSYPFVPGFHNDELDELPGLFFTDVVTDNNSWHFVENQYGLLYEKGHNDYVFSVNTGLHTLFNKIVKGETKW